MRSWRRFGSSPLGLIGAVMGPFVYMLVVVPLAALVRRRFTKGESSNQVGSVEDELPDIIDSPISADAGVTYGEFDAVPPILRPEIPSMMKILTVGEKYEQLHNFQMFLGLSDRLFRIEGEFLRWPHTTKIIWAVHRVIFIFTDATGQLSLYYDIELKEPLEITAGGSILQTTTIITENRIFVPIPPELELAFQITEGTKEFYVRFDTIP